MKKSMKTIIGLAIAGAVAFGGYKFANTSASPNTEEAEEAEKVAPVGPEFNADSAFAFCDKQCSFGPRIMNSDAHDKCGKWIIEKFKSYGCKVTTQDADLKGYDGTMLKSSNIMASVNPDASTRILICAHWDCRPWADNDPDSTNHKKPVMAANDAASGIGVMLELARILNNPKLSQNFPKDLGVDFVCFDAEDWGVPSWETNYQDTGDSWALGAQYFSKNLPQGYEARYGILLDMVAGQGAHFYQEQGSLQYAPEIVKKVWKAARQAGYRDYFPNDKGGWITDDHVPVNQNTNIPTIDVIAYYPECMQSSFGPTWHTVQDDMAHIDKSTLKAVGQTLIQVLYTEMK